MTATIASPMLAAPPDRPADVDAIIAGVSPEHLRATIDHLVTFGTRHTLSTREDANRGIGAAARWLRDELASYAKTSGRSDITVELMEFVQPPSAAARRGGAGAGGGGGGDGASGAASQTAATVPARSGVAGTPLTDVVMTIPGSMPGSKDRRFVVLGHYDSRNGRGNDSQADAPGANDDGSGTALVLELARVMAASKIRPECTVVFLMTAAEEQGLWGAQWYARTAVDNKWRIDAALSNDIVGDSSDRNGKADRSRIRIYSEGVPTSADARTLQRIHQLAMENDLPSRQLARYVDDISKRHDTAVKPWLIFRPDRFGRGGDHSAFNELGFASVRFTEIEENFDRQHQNVTEKDGKPYGDVPAFVDEKYLAGVAALNGAALWTLANAPAAPNARFGTGGVGGLGYDTTIRWDANAEPDVAGYEVVWRDTINPMWDHVIDAGDVTTFTSELSKDNYYFGVRAYDKDGHRSLITFCGTGGDRAGGAGGAASRPANASATSQPSP